MHLRRNQGNQAGYGEGACRGRDGLTWCRKWCEKPHGQSGRERYCHNDQQVEDEVPGVNGRTRTLEGEYRSGHQDRHHGGSDQDASRQRNVAGGYRRRCDGGNLTGRQADGGDAVAEGSGRDHGGDQPGESRKEARADYECEEELAPGGGQPSQGPRLNADRRGEHEHDQKHIDALVVHHPQQRALDGESEDGGHRHHRQFTVLTQDFAVPPGHRGSFHRSVGLNVAVPCCPDVSILVFLLVTRVLT